MQPNQAAAEPCGAPPYKLIVHLHHARTVPPSPVLRQCPFCAAPSSALAAPRSPSLRSSLPLAKPSAAFSNSLRVIDPPPKLLPILCADVGLHQCGTLLVLPPAEEERIQAQRLRAKRGLSEEDLKLLQEAQRQSMAEE